MLVDDDFVLAVVGAVMICFLLWGLLGDGEE